MHYKLTHDTPTLLRILVGMRKEDSIYPHEDYFLYISPSNLRANILELFSDIQSLYPQQVKKNLGLSRNPIQSVLELAPGVSLNIKPMGNWRRIYRDEKVEKGYCPYVEKEFSILSNGNVALCYLDYDGRTVHPCHERHLQGHELRVQMF